jgi:hypothetical protein
MLSFSARILGPALMTMAARKETSARDRSVTIKALSRKRIDIRDTPGKRARLAKAGFGNPLLFRHVWYVIL